MEALTLLLAQITADGVAFLASIFYVRLFFQKRADHMRQTYEIAFPRGMTQVQVLDFVLSAIGELPRPRFRQPAYTLVFEKYADREGKRYYLHIPGHVRT
jgi:hypothetical protein